MIAVVTGSNKGIGFSIAEGLVFSKMISRVILACRNSELAEQAAQELRSKYTESTATVECMTLDISSAASIESFIQALGAACPEGVDLLINNAATAFKGSDPTPFAQQARPTINTNYTGTVLLTSQMLSLLKKRPSPRVVTVASQSGLLKPSYSNEKKGIFLSSASSLTYEQLDTLMEGFIVAAESNNHKEEGYPNSCYGISKAGVIAFTKILSRLEPSVLSNCLCPGYCDTDMTSHGGDRTPEKGAETALYLALSEDTLVKQGGKFFYDLKEIQWESE